MGELVKLEQTLGEIDAADKDEKVAEIIGDKKLFFKAVERKIRAQADYVVERAMIVVPSQRKGKQRKQDGISDLKSHNLPAGDNPVRVTRWRKALCVNDESGKPVKDDAKIKRAIDERHNIAFRVTAYEALGTVRGTEGTGEFERYTPPDVIAIARRVLGQIDLDPAACAVAQKWIKAKKFFTVENNGLNQKWHGRVWLNPPYHRELAPKFIDKLIGERAVGRVSAAVVLTNNSTDTAWFRAAADACNAICFTTGRIKFLTDMGERVLPTQGQSFFYFGADVELFSRHFRKIGFVLLPTRGGL
jgi:hypothetical protein